jgi:hypothetical protein
MNWKRCRRKQLYPNLRYNHGIYLEELRIAVKNLWQDSWSPGLNMGYVKQEC